MRYNELIESRSSACIVVDVQPEYTGINDGDELPWIDELMGFLNRQSGPILMFINAEDTGLTNDTKQDVMAYWADSGFTDWDRVTIVDKGYGYLRGWMDQGIDPRVIIRVIREMYSQGVSDSRELFGGDNSDDYVDKMGGLGVPEHILDDAISVEWTSISQLKRYGGGYIMGGGRSECLREVELLMSAFNIRAKRIEDFVYGD